MSIVWAVLIYGVTIMVLAVATRLAPIVLVPVVLVYKAITGQIFLHPWHPVFVFINVVASYLTVEIAVQLLHSHGYTTFWPIPLCLILINLYVGALPDIATRGMSYSIVIAMLIFWGSLIFRP